MVESRPAFKVNLNHFQSVVCDGIMYTDRITPNDQYRLADCGLFFGGLSPNDPTA